MKIEANSPEEYLTKIPEERQEAMNKLWQVITDNIPEGFAPVMQYNMPSYVVPHSIFPDGYHVNPSIPLPFLSIASQKNFIAFYHSGIYANPEISEWFIAEYPKHVKTKLDMGKSCVRFKKPELIPFELIAELMKKITVQDYVDIYQSNIKKK